MDLLRETLLKKGSPSNSFPKTFNLKSHTGRLALYGIFLPLRPIVKNHLKKGGKLGKNTTVKPQTFTKKLNKMRHFEAFLPVFGYS